MGDKLNLLKENHPFTLMSFLTKVLYVNFVADRLNVNIRMKASINPKKWEYIMQTSPIEKSREAHCLTTFFLILLV
jgi:hypothetical protein